MRRERREEGGRGEREREGRKEREESGLISDYKGEKEAGVFLVHLLHFRSLPVTTKGFYLPLECFSHHTRRLFS